MRKRIADFLESLSFRIRPLPIGAVRIATRPVAGAVYVIIQYDTHSHTLAITTSESDRVAESFLQSASVARLDDERPKITAGRLPANGGVSCQK